MVSVADDACRIEHGKLIIAFESDSLDELMSQQLSKMAIEEARRFGWSNTAINGQNPPMPVPKPGRFNDSDGDLSYEELTKLANTNGVRYRKEVILVAK